MLWLKLNHVSKRGPGWYINQSFDLDITTNSAFNHKLNQYRFFFKPLSRGFGGLQSECRFFLSRKLTLILSPECLPFYSVNLVTKIQVIVKHHSSEHISYNIYNKFCRWVFLFDTACDIVSLGDFMFSILPYSSCDSGTDKIAWLPQCQCSGRYGKYRLLLNYRKRDAWEWSLR